VIKKRREKKCGSNCLLASYQELKLSDIMKRVIKKAPISQLFIYLSDSNIENYEKSFSLQVTYMF